MSMPAIERVLPLVGQLPASIREALARQQADGSNPGDGYIRLALVQDSETIAEALHRLVQTLDHRGAP